MARKVLISFLGTSQYQECKYSYPDGSGRFSESVRFIQEATLEYLVNEDSWTSEDVVYIVLTEESETNNWNDDHIFVTDFIDSNNGKYIREDKQENGLDSRLETFKKNYGLHFKIKSIKLTKDEEKDMWKIFEKVFSVIKDDDNLYIDVTHGYRYLPMFLLILCNYSKFLKNVKVKGITYGNYEGRNGDVAPIVDLLPLTQLQDWTFAAGQYLDSGNVKQLVEMKDKVESEELNSIIDKLVVVIKERQTCRGLSIHNSENLALLKENLDNYFKKGSGNNCSEEPLHNILRKIDDSLKDFKGSPDVMNGFYAAQWCVDNGLYQQAITMLRENIITFFCVKKGYKINVYNFNRAFNRACVEDALNLREKGKTIDGLIFKGSFDKENSESEEQKKKCEEQKKKYKDSVEEIMNDKLLTPDVVELWSSVRDYRNNFNHNGMNVDPMVAEDLEEYIKDKVKKAIRLFSEKEKSDKC